MKDQELIRLRLSVLSFALFAVLAGQPSWNIVLADDLAAVNKAAETSFTQNVLPILKRHCYECHSHETGKAKGGLVLDSRSGWAKGGESGPVVVPGKPDESLLISAVRYEDYEMPPTGKLPDELIARLEQWVTEGAHDPRVTQSARTGEGIDLDAGRKHWAFQPLGDAPPPEVSNAGWPLRDVDRFVLAKLEENGLRPVAEADRYTWLRRVSFDLTGLPPTVEEIREFEADESPQAFEQVVDRLLDSRAFGERWARHWLDLVGYADQVGTSNSVFAQHAWRYRDYVIDALNNDKPFDQFIREQVAGDLLPYDTVEQHAAGLVATGFLVLGDIEIVEADKAKLRVDIVDQQVAKTARAFLGMTIDCARCHDHKFDPIPQRDYYAIGGFFHGTSTTYKTERGVWSDVNVNDLPETDAQKAEREQRAKTHAEGIAKLQLDRTQAQQRKVELDEELKNNELPKDEQDRLTKERNETNALIGTLNRDIQHAEFFVPTVPQAHGVHDVENPGNMQITIRGNPRALGDEVPRGFLSVVTETPPEIPPGQSGRLHLANWIADDDNPLTARVAVNRVWQKLFGKGIVPSVDYFGLPGGRPSHPELLDALANRFIHDGWSQQQLIRSLVLSRTYRLDSAHNDHAHATDPDNRLLWRMNRVRLDAEALRDAMILVSGQLQPSTGGPSMPLEFPENVGGLDPKDVNPPHFRLAKWRPSQEVERTIYLPVIRHSGQPGPAALRNVFDFPQPSQFTGQRATTAVPTQALFLMNGAVVKERAAAVAARLTQASDDPAERLERLWLTLLNRPISEAERREAQAFLSEAGDDAWPELCHALLASNEFLMRL
ncbi:MAG: PSD1 and planctomycete cytochrome C domain-containing protein [Planctomycetota bacterium]|nr:PSD1 and planctomycete cytochrome C domain-containing protein [Planctomycetota bacterium]